MGRTEAETCRHLIVPALEVAGWTSPPAVLQEQLAFTDGQVHLVAGRPVRGPGRRADYVLRVGPDLPLAVVEAKREGEAPARGLQQAKDYAAILGLRFAYATSGREWVEWDASTGRESVLAGPPTPAELWQRHAGDAGLTEEQQRLLLTPGRIDAGRPPRYYQEQAVAAVLVALGAGERRALLTLATGTGKTWVAFQVAWRLSQARWTAISGRERPRVLFLADRDVLVDDPQRGAFAAFGDARARITAGRVQSGRLIFFSTYQALAAGDARTLRQYPPEFFDLVIVDECHRGSARTDSQWRAILDHFAPAVKLGLTATPIRAGDRDTVAYFGEPLMTYSLRQGVADGFLAPYRLRRILTRWDAEGWRPSAGELDRYGRAIPDEEFQTGDFERVVALRARTEAVAKHLTAHLKATDRFAKTIVFCVDQEHADEMRRALSNLNSDLMRTYPEYVARVTSDEGVVGRALLARFQDPESRTPAIVTTSQMLTTGVDVPTCENIAIVRVVGSMIEFKQIIGRGTRLKPEYGKLAFTILDYTGSASKLFADPDFDGEPLTAEEAHVDDDGRELTVSSEREPAAAETTERPHDPDLTNVDEQHDADRGSSRSPKYYYDGGQVEIVADVAYELDADGRQLRAVSLREYVRDRVRESHCGPMNCSTTGRTRNDARAS